MGTIAEKLSYLTDTKDLFKDRLNSLGAEITSSTTFRNYLTWLDTFYGEASDKTNLSQNGIVGRTSQNTAILPSEYTQVDYIESSGTQYIDTGVNADNNLRVVLDFAYTSALSANQNIGAIRLESGNNARYHILLGGSPATNRTRVFVNDGGYYTIYDDTNRHLYDINPSIGRVLVDNISYTIPSDIRDVGLNFWLFGRNSTSTIYLSRVKQWACQMYYNNVLVRDFIPCYRNSDNEVGLYDLVNNVFYTNQGTGAFTYGSVVSIPNPDYPQPINNLSGDVPYKVIGKNLFQSPTTPSFYDKATYNKINDNSFSLSYTQSTSTTNSAYVRIDFDTSKLKPNTEYTISKINKIEGESFGNIGALRTRINGVNGDVINSNSLTFTTPSIMNNVGVYFYIAYNTTTTGTSTITFENIQLEENSTVTDFEPYISQTFDIPLKSTNLANLDIIGRVPSVSNGQMVDFTGGVSSDFIEVDNTKEYIFQYDFSGINERYIFFYDEDKNFISSISGENNVPSGVHINSFISFSRSKYIKLRIDKQSNINWIQLEENSTPTDYEPYYDIELCKIDTYEDKIYSSNGRFYLYKEIYKNKMLSSYSWYSSNFTNFKFRSKTLRPSIADEKCYCNLYKQASINDVFNGRVDYGVGLAADAGIAFRNKDIPYELDVWKTYLDNNDVILYYGLDTPTTTEITQENYPSLYNALKQIQDYLTAYKINKEFILGYSSPEIEY